MRDSTFSTSLWLVKLTRTFFKGAPVSTLISVFTTLISQIAMMLAFLMPLKVVMLLGSDVVPSYIPEVFRSLGKNTLIISLVMLSLTSYLISVLFNQVSEKSTKRGVNKLLKKTQKIIIFENQDSFASKAYTKYTNALAGLVFSFFTLVLFSIFYSDMAVFIVTVLFFSYLITYILYSSIPKLKRIIIDKPQPTASSISNIVFFLMFLYIVVDFLYLTPPGFIVGLIALILSRLMLARLSFTTSFFFTLKQDEGKINALFFHNHAFIPTIKPQQNIWDILVNDTLENWVAPILEEATNSNSLGKIVIKWQQTQLKHILVVLAKSEAQGKTFLIKIFEKRVNSQALHEATLLVDTIGKHLPCPPFLLSILLRNFHCHVFDITKYELVPSMQAKNYINTINEELMVFPPPTILIERYKRSKAFLWERIEKGMLERLHLVTQEKDKHVILEIGNALPRIKKILQGLPLSFVSPKPNNTTLLKNSMNEIVTYHWSDWVIEPLGTGIKPKEKNTMNRVIKSAGIHRPEIKEFSVQAFEIASLLAEFESKYHQQQFEDAIQLLSLVLDNLLVVTSGTTRHKTLPSDQQ